MPRLILNLGTPQECQIELAPGSTRLGRSPDNDFSIEHGSISASHCQITVDDGSVRVLDLGSTNGTFIDSNPTQEGLLRSGQTLKLGDIELLFDGDTPEELIAAAAMPAPAPAPIPIPPPIPEAPPLPDGPLVCSNHRKSEARFQCKGCRTLFCSLCVTTRRADGAQRKFCRTCGAECEWLSAALLYRPVEEKSFRELLPQAFKYPFQGDGWVLMVTGTIFYMFVDFVIQAGSFAYFAKGALLVVSIFAYGYMFAYQLRIIAATVEGRDEMPDWPDFSGMEDVARPFFQALATIVVCFLPGGIALFVFRDQEWGRAAAMTIFAMGGLYLPMSFLAVALFDAVEVLNPLFIIPSILRVLQEYLVACGLLVAIVVIHIIVSFVLERYVPIMGVSGAISGFIGLYFLTVEMRILGLLYRTQQDSLGWFKH
ncbi:MAG: domain containing protein [Pedosphaera sp.]|nr:domain containing protein [Pedosphaera sp.]